MCPCDCYIYIYNKTPLTVHICYRYVIYIRRYTLNSKSFLNRIRVRFKCEPISGSHANSTTTNYPNHDFGGDVLRWVYRSVHINMHAHL